MTEEQIKILTLPPKEFMMEAIPDLVAFLPPSSRDSIYRFLCLDEYIKRRNRDALLLQYLKEWEKNEVYNTNDTHSMGETSLQ